MSKYWWRKWASEPGEIYGRHVAGIRFLTGDGQIAIMCGDPEGECQRVALVDSQTKYKRGAGYKTECAERDALADLIVAALNGAKR